MKRDEVLRLLAEHHAELDAMGVESVSIFGSVARDEAGRDSDVDLLVDIRRPMGFFHFHGIKEYLELLLGRPVDLVTRQALKRQLREQVLRELVRAT